MVDISYYRPCCDIVIGGGNHIDIVSIGPSCITWIGCFGIVGLNDVIVAIQCLVTNQLDLHFTVPELLNNKNSHILLLISIESHPEHNVVYIILNVIIDGYIIYHIVPVQIQVIDLCFLAVQAALKSFKRL